MRCAQQGSEGIEPIERQIGAFWDSGDQPLPDLERLGRASLREPQVAEVQGGSWQMNDWHTPGRREDFAHLYRDWRFDWVDVPDLIDRADRLMYESKHAGRNRCTFEE